MKEFSFYLAWTFITSLFLKAGIQFITGERIGFTGPMLINFFLQISIIFPIVSVFRASGKS